MRRQPDPGWPRARTALLDTPPEEAFDRLTRLAARLLGAPVALITVVGRRPPVPQERHGRARAVGQPGAALPLAYSFCRHVVESGAAAGGRGRPPPPAASAPIPAIRELGWIAYAGVPLTTARGHDGRRAQRHRRAARGSGRARDVALLQDLAASRRHRDRAPRRRRGRDRRSRAVRSRAAPQPAPGPGRCLRARRPADGPRRSRRPLAPGQSRAGRPARQHGRGARRLPRRAVTHPADRAADREATRLLLAGECASYTAEKRCSASGGEPRLGPRHGDGGCPVEPACRRSYHVALAGHRRPQAGRGDAARAGGALPPRGEATQDAVWDWDLADRPDRRGTSRTSGAFGYRPRRRGGTAAWWYERIHADDRERIVSGIQAAIARGATELGRRVPLPRRRWPLRRTCGIAPAIVRDEAGDAVRMVGRGWTDVTERMRAELLAHGQSRLLEQIAAGLDLGRACSSASCGFTEEHGERSARDPDGARSRDPDAQAGVAGRACRTSCVPRSPSCRWRSTRDSAPPRRVRRERVVVADLAGDPAAERLARSRSWRRASARRGRSRCSPRTARCWARSRCTTPSRAAPGRGRSSRASSIASHLAEIAIERDRNEEALARSNRLLEQVLEHAADRRLGARPRRAGSASATPPAGQIWGGARYVGSRSFGEFRGWRAETGEPDRAGGVGGGARHPAGRDHAQRGGADRDASTASQRTILNSAVPLRGAWTARSSGRSPSTRTSPSSAPARRRCAGARSSSARRRRWRRSGSSRAASPTTSTTCSPAS